jgi:hypothetical protein
MTTDRYDPIPWKHLPEAPKVSCITLCSDSQGCV